MEQGNTTPRAPGRASALVGRARRAIGAAALACGALLLVAGSVSGQEPGDAGVADAGLDATDGSDASPGQDPQVERLRQRATAIRDFIEEQLDPGIDPTTLFDVPLDDDHGIRVEVERLRAVEFGSRREGGIPPPATIASATSEDAGGEGGSPDGGVPEDAILDPARWAAQLELDRARLAFYDLPKSRRDALFASHADRQAANRAAKKTQQLSAADRKARAAADARKQALEAARRAKSEGERAVRLERARLLDIVEEQANYEKALVLKEKELEALREVVLKIRRRVRESLEAPPATDDADALYDELRTVLVESRVSLLAASATFAQGETDTPVSGDDPLAALAEDIDKQPASSVRKQVDEAAAILTERELKLVRERARTLNQHVETLNADRLALLPLLSPAKREAILGFGRAGLEQATAEARQVWVVMHYHLVATVRWISDMRTPGAGRGESALTASFILLKWLFPIVVFVWWRRRAQKALQTIETALTPNDLKGRARDAGPGPFVRAVHWLIRVRTTLEWLLLIWAVTALLPPEAQGLLEVEVIKTIFTWTLGGSLVVQTIDFLAAENRPRQLRDSKLQTGHIRLRSLRLVGRVVVSFGLILALTSKLVGEGTVYGWVIRLCWFSAIPVGLLLVKWWRAVIFELTDRKRRKNRVDEWIAANPRGWQSLFAAIVGGGLLLVGGAVRFVRAWAGTFVLTRRVLAYLFSRELSKKAETEAQIALGPIPAASYGKLSPARATEISIGSIADEQIREVIDHIQAVGGGVFALVGERGAGKTTMLKRIETEVEHVVDVQCPFGGMEEFAPALLKALGADAEARLEDAAREYDESDHEDAGIVIDNAHRLILPMMGGLKSFDRVLALARNHSKNTAWVFAFDEVIWRFLERMRGARPTFDEVIHLEAWDESEIAELLLQRTRAASLEPQFDHLIGELPPDADEIDREEALANTEASYYRLVWDYAGGNPGAALHAWREALGVDPEGNVRVKVFRAPRSEELEKLPDAAIFVLKALIQLERAEPEDLVRATGIDATDVQNVLRFGSVRGYFAKTADGYRVSWTWFRAVTLLLERRHLLFRGA